ncbi:MAG TPA: cobalt ABC transporter ATP-binding protein, partial [Clostridiales bacterium]|nr:cobalt ABC transporter ATP-binding protein [Clostridiales bacterium]
MGKTILEVKDFSFTYNQAINKVLDHVNFRVDRGSFFCIIGANGSGKSTLCNSLVGLIPHYFSGEMEGGIRVDGMDVRKSSIGELSQKIGLVFQNPFNQLSYTAGTVAEELAYGLGNRGVPGKVMQEKIEHMAQLMRIDDVLSKNPTELSGGQVQRVALGSVFILDPEILVLDECTTQLDPLGAEEIFEIVKKINGSGVTVIVVDHDMERVASYADEVLVLSGGRAVKIGSP